MFNILLFTLIILYIIYYIAKDKIIVKFNRNECLFAEISLNYYNYQ